MSKHFLSLFALTCSLVAGNAQAQSIFQTQYQTQPVNYSSPTNYTPVNYVQPQYNSNLQYNSQTQPNCFNGQCTTGQCSTGQCSTGQCPTGQPGTFYPQANQFQNQTFFRGSFAPNSYQNQNYVPRTTQSEILPMNNFNGANFNAVNVSGFDPANGYRRPQHSNAYGTQRTSDGVIPCMHPGCTGHTNADRDAFRTRMQQQFNAVQLPNQQGTSTFPMNYPNQYQAGTNQNLQIQLQQPLQNPAIGSPFFN